MQNITKLRVLMALLFVVWAANAAEDFRYKDLRKISDDGLRSVQFKNGSHLIALKNKPDDYSNGKILLKDKGNSLGKDLLNNDRVYINAAFPNRTYAELAIISGECAGNASFCGIRPAYLVVAEGGMLRAYEYGDSRSEILMKIDGAGGVSAKVSQVVLGMDAFGSDIYGNLTYVRGEGFIDVRAKQYYVELMGKHPSKFFDNINARAKLANTIGVEKFRELRASFNVGGTIYFTNWRFIVVTGCKAHACDDTAGVLIVDATNDDFWLLHREGKTFDTVGSRAIEKYEVGLFEGNLPFEGVLSGISLVRGYRLEVARDGFLTLTPKKN